MNREERERGRGLFGLLVVVAVVMLVSFKLVEDIDRECRLGQWV